MIEENTKESKSLKPTIKESTIADKGKIQPQNNAMISNEEQKQLDDLLSSNVQEIQNPRIQRVNTSIIEEIFSENLDTIVQEIEK